MKETSLILFVRPSAVLYLAICAAACCLLPGCNPAKPSAEDLGTVTYEIPKLPGDEKPYAVPELDLPEQKGHKHTPKSPH